MYLSQTRGFNDHGGIFPLTFGLLNSEREPGYAWILQHLKKITCQVQAAIPKVVLADKEPALKNALGEVWPTTQQQLYV